MRNSIVSASLEAAIINAKYVNAIPFYRQEQEFERYGVSESKIVSIISAYTIKMHLQLFVYFYPSYLLGIL